MRISTWVTRNEHHTNSKKTARWDHSREGDRVIHGSCLLPSSPAREKHLPQYQGRSSRVNAQIRNKNEESACPFRPAQRYQPLIHGSVLVCRIYAQTCSDLATATSEKIACLVNKTVDYNPESREAHYTQQNEKPFAMTLDPVHPQEEQGARYAPWQVRKEKERQQHKAESRDKKKEKDQKEKDAKLSRMNVGGGKKQKERLSGGRTGHSSSSTSGSSTRNI